jgi:fatty-acid desaturase
MPVLRFLYSQTGRVVRVVVGLALIAAGALLGGWWWLLAVVGLVPLATGIFDICTLGPLFHRPLSGRRFRQEEAALKSGHRRT